MENYEEINEIYQSTINCVNEICPDIAEKIEELHNNPTSDQIETYQLIGKTIGNYPKLVDEVVGALYCSKECNNYLHVVGALNNVSEDENLLKIIAKSFNKELK